MKSGRVRSPVVGCDANIDIVRVFRVLSVLEQIKMSERLYALKKKNMPLQTHPSTDPRQMHQYPRSHIRLPRDPVADSRLRALRMGIFAGDTCTKTSYKNASESSLDSNRAL